MASAPRAQVQDVTKTSFEPPQKKGGEWKMPTDTRAETLSFSSWRVGKEGAQALKALSDRPVDYLDGHVRGRFRKGEEQKKTKLLGGKSAWDGMA
jgi:hypothetical protein